MRGILVIVSALLFFSSPGKVFICTGPQSKCYHKTNKCKGLRSCSKEIKQISLKEAEEMGRRPCKICYGG